MFDRWAFLLLAGAGTPWTQPAPDARNAVQPAATAQAVMRLHLDVSGRATADCATRVLSIPIPSGGIIHAEVGGVAYDGRETSNHLLVLRSNEPRPLALSGNETTGGRWSRGVDGRCVGTWRVSR